LKKVSIKNKQATILLKTFECYSIISIVH
jgi:hypothetical protein